MAARSGTDTLVAPGRRELTTSVLVVEDDGPVRSLITRSLQREGFDAHAVVSASDAVSALRATPFALVVLDLKLPDAEGFDVLARIRDEFEIPTIIVSGRGAEGDRVLGLTSGADDYVTKPFSPRELVARVHALLRRREPERGDDAPFLTGDLEIDPAARRVRRGGEEVHLTPTEFDLLHHLAARPGRVFPREQLLADVWGYRDGSGARTVDSHVRALRKKLGAGVIRTVHGVGYAFEGDAA